MAKLILEDGEYITEIPPDRPGKSGFHYENVSEVSAPIPGVIVGILKKEGDDVSENETILKLEAMKMENELLCKVSGKVEKIFVKIGDKVKKNDILMKLAIGEKR